MKWTKGKQLFREFAQKHKYFKTAVFEHNEGVLERIKLEIEEDKQEVTINFYPDRKQYYIEGPYTVSMELHQALHQVLKDLGWIDG